MRQGRLKKLVLVGTMALGWPLGAKALTNRQALKIFDRMAEKLCLTTEQRSETFFLLLHHAEEIRVLLRAQEAATASLRDAVTQPVYEETLILKRAEEKAAAEREAALLTGKLFASFWAKLDPRQQEVVRAYLASSGTPRNELLKGIEAFSGSSDLYLTVKSQPPAR